MSDIPPFLQRDVHQHFFHDTPWQRFLYGIYEFYCDFVFAFKEHLPKILVCFALLGCISALSLSVAMRTQNILIALMISIVLCALLIAYRRTKNNTR